MHQMILAVKPDQVSRLFKKAIVAKSLPVYLCTLLQMIWINILDLALKRCDKLTRLGQAIIVV